MTICFILIITFTVLGGMSYMLSDMFGNYIPLKKYEKLCDIIFSISIWGFICSFLVLIILLIIKII